MLSQTLRWQIQIRVLRKCLCCLTSDVWTKLEARIQSKRLTNFECACALSWLPHLNLIYFMGLATAVWKSQKMPDVTLRESQRIGWVSNIWMLLEKISCLTLPFLRQNPFSTGSRCFPIDLRQALSVERFRLWGRSSKKRMLKLTRFVSNETELFWEIYCFA